MLMYILFFALVNLVTCNIGYFGQITDIHYDQNYKIGAPTNCLFGKSGLGCCRSTSIPLSPAGSANYWGNYFCDTPFSLANSTLQYISQMNIPLSFILWTGDNANHHDFTQSMSQNINASITITNLFKQYFPDTLILPVIGNHDSFPIDQIGPDGIPIYDDMYKKLYEAWRQWLNPLWGSLISDFETNVSKSKIKQGVPDTDFNDGYYGLQISNELRLLVLNNLYFDTNNIFYKLLGKQQKEQMDWLNNELIYAQENGYKLYIIGHIEPSSGEVSKEFTNTIVSYVQQYKNNVIALFFGHTHNNEYMVFYDKDNVPINVGYITAAVKPGNNSPGFRIYEYNTTTGEILDFYQYSLNLTDLINGGPFEYILLYSAKETYGLNDMSANSWFQFAEQMKYNKTTMNMYSTHYYNGKNMNCDDSCKNGMLHDILCSTIDMNCIF